MGLLVSGPGLRLTILHTDILIDIYYLILYTTYQCSLYTNIYYLKPHTNTIYQWIYVLLYTLYQWMYRFAGMVASCIDVVLLHFPEIGGLVKSKLRIGGGVAGDVGDSGVGADVFGVATREAKTCGATSASRFIAPMT